MFKPKFAPLVKSGAKRQTIRPVPKRAQDQPKPGDLESWREWLGVAYRSKQAKLARVELVSVERCCVHSRGIKVGGRPVKSPDDFARAAGFTDWPEMKAWFEADRGLPCEGNLIIARDTV